MKKLNKKNVLLACLSLSLVAGTAGAFAINTKTASANTNTMQMINGASLYLSANNDGVTGLKFSFTDSAYDENASYGMLIVANDMLEAAQTALADSEITGVDADDYVNLLAKAQEAGVFNENDKYINVAVAPNADGVFSHSVGSLNGYNYVREFIGIGYKVTGEDTYDYATLNNNVRSVFEVANLALNANVYDGGDLDGNGELDAEEQAEKAKIDENETDVKAYVSKGLSFVYGDWDGKAEDYNEATLAIEYTDYIYIDTEKKIEVEPTISTAKTKNIDLKMHWRADTTTATRAAAQPIDFMLADVVKVEDVSLDVLKDKTEYEVSKYSAKENRAGYFHAVEKHKNAFSTAALSGGHFRSSSSYTKTSTGHLTFTNPNAEDGKFTLDENGTYIDFYFQGNNMPNVEFFSTNIANNTNIWSNSGTDEGYVVSNGYAHESIYEAYDQIVRGSNNDGQSLMNVDLNEAKTAGKIVNVNNWNPTGTANFIYNGLALDWNYFAYGVTGYDKLTRKTFADYQGYNSTHSVGLSFKYAHRASGTWTLNKTMYYSNFSMYALMADETINWHYVVGMKLVGSDVYVDAKLYKMDANGDDIDNDTSTTEVDAFATFNGKADTLSAGTVRSGYVVARGALKGTTSDTKNPSVRTRISYTLPYSGATLA